MKTKIEVFCDASSKSINGKELSKLISIFNHKKSVIKINITIIEEINNNKAELINLLNAIKICNSFEKEIKGNHPIIIYSDSRYAIDTVNQFFAYVKQLRGNPTLYHFFEENGYCMYQKTNKYFSYSKARKKINSCNIDSNEFILTFMELMNTNYIEFKWLPREKNKKADDFSKIK